MAKVPVYEEIRCEPSTIPQIQWIKGSFWEARARRKEIERSLRERMNWSKNMFSDVRRRNALEAHKGDALATARALQALSEVTMDIATEIEAEKDARYFFERYAKERSETNK